MLYLVGAPLKSVLQTMKSHRDIMKRILGITKNGWERFHPEFVLIWIYYKILLSSANSFPFGQESCHSLSLGIFKFRCELCYNFTGWSKLWGKTNQITGDKLRLGIKTCSEKPAACASVCCFSFFLCSLQEIIQDRHKMRELELTERWGAGWHQTPAFWTRTDKSQKQLRLSCCFARETCTPEWGWGWRGGRGGGVISPPRMDRLLTFDWQQGWRRPFIIEPCRFLSIWKRHINPAPPPPPSPHLPRRMNSAAQHPLNGPRGSAAKTNSAVFTDVDLLAGKESQK